MSHTADVYVTHVSHNAVVHVTDMSRLAVVNGGNVAHVFVLNVFYRARLMMVCGGSFIGKQFYLDRAVSISCAEYQWIVCSC